MFYHAWIYPRHVQTNVGRNPPDIMFYHAWIYPIHVRANVGRITPSTMHGYIPNVGGNYSTMRGYIPDTSGLMSEGILWILSSIMHAWVYPRYVRSIVRRNPLDIISCHSEQSNGSWVHPRHIRTNVGRKPLNDIIIIFYHTRIYARH